MQSLPMVARLKLSWSAPRRRVLVARKSLNILPSLRSGEALVPALFSERSLLSS